MRTVNPRTSSRASFHKFLTGGRFTANYGPSFYRKPVLAKSCLRRRDTRTGELRRRRYRRKRARDGRCRRRRRRRRRGDAVGSERNDFSMGAFCVTFVRAGVLSRASGNRMEKRRRNFYRAVRGTFHNKHCALGAVARAILSFSHLARLNPGTCPKRLFPGPSVMTTRIGAVSILPTMSPT